MSITVNLALVFHVFIAVAVMSIGPRLSVQSDNPECYRDRRSVRSPDVGRCRRRGRWLFPLTYRKLLFTRRPRCRLSTL